jgi:CheY-like chemotaxis protein
LGLGLSIVKRSADLLGHGVALRSAQGCGTRISITMPRTQKPDFDETSVVATPQFVPSELTSVRILLIEDDDLAQEAITRLLESWGCEVSVAADGAQAKALLRPEALPDMILSDYRLEGEDNGLDIIQMLRFCAGVDLPAVLMSGDTDAELMQKAHGAGIPLLHKPVRPAKLRSLLRNFQGAGAV